MDLFTLFNMHNRNVSYFHVGCCRVVYITLKSVATTINDTQIIFEFFKSKVIENKTFLL